MFILTTILDEEELKVRMPRRSVRRYPPRPLPTAEYTTLGFRL